MVLILWLRPFASEPDVFARIALDIFENAPHHEGCPEVDAELQDNTSTAQIGFAACDLVDQRWHAAG